MTKPLQWHIEQRRVKDLIPWDKNPHVMDDTERQHLSNSIDKFDYVEVVVINTNNIIVGGHQRIKDFTAKGKLDELIDVRVPDRKLTDKEHAELAMRLNKNRGHDDEELLKAFFSADDLKEWGFGVDELMDIFKMVDEDGNEPAKTDHTSLQERFVVPPFSVLDTRQGYWQERKRQWHKLGFDSQETRQDVDLIAKSGQNPAVYELRNKMRETLGREPEWDEILEHAKKKGLHIFEGASIFDPVLCEVMYRWFCPVGGQILDPFAGGSVRGVVAGMLGFTYQGVDLRQDQVEANYKQWQQITKENNLPKAGIVCWDTGDSNIVLENYNPTFDFIFSCPPYHDLEKYSDDPADLSNMTYAQFVVIYQSIILQAVQKLKPNRFACFVVGDIRDEKGFYRNFLQDTIDAFQHSGECKLYNEFILVNVAGSLAIRVGRQFASGRKNGKMHQNVLVFYKGDPKKIKEDFPELEMDDLFKNESHPEGVELL